MNHAAVLTKSIILGNARVNGGRMFNSKVSGRVTVMEDATLRGAVVTGNAMVRGRATMEEGSLIKDAAFAFDYCVINKGAVVCGDAMVYGSATVHEGVWGGNADICSGMWCRHDLSWLTTIVFGLRVPAISRRMLARIQGF